MSEHVTEELLSAYLDGELSSSERATVDRQLENSLSLREELAALREVSLQVRMLPRPYAPSNFRNEVLDQIESGTGKYAPRARSGTAPRFSRLAGWAAIALVALLLLVTPFSLIPTLQFPFQENSENSLAMKERQEPAAAPAMPMIRQQIAPSVHELATGNAPTFAGASFGLPQGLQDQEEPVQVITVSKDEIRRRIDGLNRSPQRGNSIEVNGRLKDGQDEIPIIVEFTVVDVMEAMNQMQVLVQRQRVKSPEDQIIELKQDSSRSAQLTAVTMELEMNGQEMAAVLNSVSAFNAVLYVENEDQKTPTREMAQGAPAGQSAPLDVLPAPASEPAILMGTEKHPADTAASVENFAMSQQRADRIAGQRQFDFRQLADPSQAAANSFSATVADDRSRAANPPLMNKASRSNGQAPQQSDNVRSMTNQAPKAQFDNPAGTDQLFVRGGQQSHAKKMEKPDLTSDDQAASAEWSDLPRFRAFVLLKRQSPDQQSPLKPIE